MAIGEIRGAIIPGSTITRIVVSAIILALFALAGLGYTVFRSNLAALEELNQEKLDWSTNRLLQELSLFQRELVRLQADHPDASPASVNQRFDILWSRLAQTEQGAVGERLGSYDKDTHTLKYLFKTVRDNETAVVGIQQADTAGLIDLQAQFFPFEAKVTDFNRQVFVGEERRVSQVRQDINRSAFLTVLASVGAFMTIGLALAAVSRESRLNRNMAEDNLMLAKAAEEANLAKSRFLTMMSHELRTPMNGVLGMLALTQQQGLPPKQMRLLSQAEASGQQMIAMLSDILDYSALQDNQMKLEDKPFEPQLLADAIRGLFGSVARREGIAFSVSCAPDCPERISGDFKRLRQIVGHFASYIVDTAGTENIEIFVNYQSGQLGVSIGFDYGGLIGRETVWHPEILLGTQKDTDDQFATDALGPAVARGVLQQMGGTIRLDHPTSDRIAILLNVPAKKVEISILNIVIDTRSQALHTICQVALEDDNTTVVDGSDPANVHKVLVEAGGHDELQRIKDMSRQYPRALLIALGDPLNPADFDGTITIPIDIATLRANVLEHW